MMYLLSPEGREAMRAVAGRPMLYAFDFDGTLAKISPDRESVKLSRSIHEWLAELAKRAPCAVISGRGLRDLAPRVNGAVPYLIGNHGLESPLTPSVTLLWADGICAGWRAAMKGELAMQLADLGIEVEDKRYSLTLHYRKREEEDRIRPILLTLLSRLNPAPRLIIGKQSINLLPPGKGGKGAAALELMRHLRQPAFFFIGDDETVGCVCADGRAGHGRAGRTARRVARKVLYQASRGDRRCPALLDPSVGSDTGTGPARRSAGDDSMQGSGA